MRTLERRMRAVTRRLGHRPGTRPALARAAAIGDPAVVGSWSSVIPAPVVPIFEALLPSGKIPDAGLGRRRAGRELRRSHVHARGGLRPGDPTPRNRVDVAGANIFCAGFVQLANGNVFVAGGDSAPLNGIRAAPTRSTGAPRR